MDMSKWRCINENENVIEIKTCKCGKSNIRRIEQEWENVLTGEKRQTYYLKYDCPDDCHLSEN